MVLVFSWAYLVAQKLVRDEVGDRESYFRLVEVLCPPKASTGEPAKAVGGTTGRHATGREREEGGRWFSGSVQR